MWLVGKFCLNQKDWVGPSDPAIEIGIGPIMFHKPTFHY
jgi:hypothetical protein